MGKLEPFAEVLFRNAHANFHENACSKLTGLCASKPPSNSAFSFAVGGDVALRRARKSRSGSWTGTMC